MPLRLRDTLDGALAVFGVSTSAAFYRKSDDTNGAAIAVVNVNSTGAEAAPASVSRIPSAAGSTNATVAKASPGDLYMVTGYNAAAAVRYLKFYNKATSPTVGTDVPILTLALQASTAFNIKIDGLYFSAGIAYALTTGAADADTGALTAADIVGLNVIYA